MQVTIAQSYVGGLPWAIDADKHVSRTFKGGIVLGSLTAVVVSSSMSDIRANNGDGHIAQEGGTCLTIVNLAGPNPSALKLEPENMTCTSIGIETTLDFILLCTVGTRGVQPELS